MSTEKNNLKAFSRDREFTFTGNTLSAEQLKTAALLRIADAAEIIALPVESSDTDQNSKP